MNFRRFRVCPVLCLLVVLLFIAACDATSTSEASAPVPASLPSGQNSVAHVAGSGPPLGKPSLAANVASIPDKLELPSINVEADVVPIGWYAVQQPDGSTVSEWEVADHAAGWHKNSARAGEGGNVVMSGHNNIAGAIFRKLYTLKEGDMAYVWAGGKRFAYEVSDVMILEEKNAPIEQRRENARWIQPFSDDRLTLVSCWPENDNSHRVVVIAKRVE